MSERLEAYCRENRILRKEFVDLALIYFERTGYDLRENVVDYSPVEKLVNELKEVKSVMESSQIEKDAITALLQAVQHQTALQLPAPDVIAQAGAAKAVAEQTAETLKTEVEELKKQLSEKNQLQSELQQLQQETSAYKAKTEEQVKNLEAALAQLKEYKEKALAELVRIRDEQSYIGKIEVKIPS